MEKMILNVYDDEDNITKSCEGKLVDIKFGTIRAIMKLLNVENIKDSGELVKAIYGAWDKLTVILERCFPDMEDEDWDNVRLKELIPIVLDIIKYSAASLVTIPSDSKNLKAE